MEVQEMKSAQELNAAPPKFVASQAGNAPAPSFDEEQAIRALFNKAAQEGVEDLQQVVVMPKAPSVEEPLPQQAPLPSKPLEVPAKFQRPDGTVDEDKLKASTERLNEAIQAKQKSIDEMLAEYRSGEKEHTRVSQQAADIRKNPPQPVAAIPTSMPDDPQALQQRIMQDYQRDPLGTQLALTQALLDQRLAPVMGTLQAQQERERDQTIRQNMTQIAERDPRFLQYYGEVINEINSDPSYRGLKNPHKAAWNEVKDRLRLGEVTLPPAQPSNPSPTLGRGSPPSVSTLPQPLSAQNLRQQVGQINPYTQEGKEFEEKLREATRDLWQA